MAKNRVHGVSHRARRKSGWKSRCDNGHGGRKNGNGNHKKPQAPAPRNQGPEKSSWRRHERTELSNRQARRASLDDPQLAREGAESMAVDSTEYSRTRDMGSRLDKLATTTHPTSSKLRTRRRTCRARASRARPDFFMLPIR